PNTSVEPYHSVRMLCRIRSSTRTFPRRNLTPSTYRFQTKRWNSTNIYGQETVELKYDVAHGSSSHSEEADPSKTFGHFQGNSLNDSEWTPSVEGEISLLGHSMGGKVAMTLALHPDTPQGLLKNLIVEDVSPIKGRLSKEFTGYAKAMRRIMNMNLKDRKEADEVLKEIEPDITVRQFLLTNVSAASSPGAPLSFRVPPDIIADSMENLGDFPFSSSSGDEEVVFDRPTLVIRGKKSNYIKDSNLPAFSKFFPNHRLAELDTGHWAAISGDQQVYKAEEWQLFCIFRDDSPPRRMFSVTASPDISTVQLGRLIAAGLPRQTPGPESTSLILWKLNQPIPSHAIDEELPMRLVDLPQSATILAPHMVMRRIMNMNLKDRKEADE
ncbi:646_t:CDS:2, partial [Acaulospora colombiana]